MKKLTTLFLSLMLIFSLAACGSKRQTQHTEPDASEPASEVNSKSETLEEPGTKPSGTETEEPESAGSKTLVVYYSATGSTENVAKVIAEVTGADLFELEPVKPYSSADLDWTNDDSRVTREHENEVERVVELVSATISNWSDYDTVFIGYPIWWGIAAWPVNEFIETNDFTGKTVIPFCTSASSGLGESGKLLEEMAKTGDWQEGQRFRSSASEEEVREWIKNLGL